MCPLNEWICDLCVNTFQNQNVVSLKEAVLCESIVCLKDAGAQLVPRPLLQMLMGFFRSPQVAGSCLAKAR